MTRGDREDYRKILDAHRRTLDVCEACAATTRDLAAQVARGSLPPREDLVRTLEEAERVLVDLAGVRTEVLRLLATLG
jgi:hypothetical protein